MTTQSANARFAPEAVSEVQRHLEEFVKAHSDVSLAVVTSGDGFEVASHPPKSVTQRIAAMGSSLQALSEAIAREAGCGRSRNLIVETEGGTILVLGIGKVVPRLSLAVVASGNEILGRLLWATRNCAAELENSLITR